MKYLELFEEMNIKSRGKGLSIDGVSYTQAKFISSIFDLVDMGNPLAVELLVLEKTDKAEFSKVVVAIFNKMKFDLKPEVAKKFDSPDTLTELSPVVGLDGNKFMVNLTDGSISDISHSAWSQVVDDEHRKANEAEALLANFVFNPYCLDAISEGVIDRGTRIVNINKYQPPQWWTKDVQSIPTPPKDYQEFMDHLFKGDAEQIKYVNCWMAESLVGRNETYLVLNGDKGVGKNTIYEILKGVIGTVYCAPAPQSLTTSHFNSVLENKRLILLDEYKVVRKNHLFLKKIINKFQTIEKKGIDAKEEIETYNSFMIFHNDVSDMYMERDDRRFSVMDITSKSLLDTWDGDKIENFLRELNDPSSELIASIGKYLLWVHQNTEFDRNKPFKGEKFYEIIEYHLPTWIQIVLTMVENGEVKDGIISVKYDIEPELEKRMMGGKVIQWRRSTIERVLREYKYKDKYSIGTVNSKGQGTGIEINVNPELLELFGYDKPEESSEEAEEDFL